MNRNDLAALKRDNECKGFLVVKDFWNQESNNVKWRKWRDLGYNDESPLRGKPEDLSQDLEHRQILVSSLPDQLRWGKNNEGNFNLKEEKQIVIGFNFVNTEQV